MAPAFTAAGRTLAGPRSYPASKRPSSFESRCLCASLPEPSGNSSGVGFRGCVSAGLPASASRPGWTLVSLLITRSLVAEARAMTLGSGFRSRKVTGESVEHGADATEVDSPRRVAGALREGERVFAITAGAQRPCEKDRLPFYGKTAVGTVFCASFICSTRNPLGGRHPGMRSFGLYPRLRRKPLRF